MENTCNHLSHDKTNEFISQSKMNQDGTYVMEFKCGNCGTKFRSYNHIIDGFIKTEDIEE